MTYSVENISRKVGWLEVKDNEDPSVCPSSILSLLRQKLPWPINRQPGGLIGRGKRLADDLLDSPESLKTPEFVYGSWFGCDVRGRIPSSETRSPK